MRRFVVCMVWAGCSVQAPPPPLAPPPPHLVPPPPCPGLDVPMHVEGMVRTSTGEPAAHTSITVWDADAAQWMPRAITGADGAYALTLDGPGWVGGHGWRSEPGAQCVSLPSSFTYELPAGAKARMVVEGFDFIGPATCGFALDLTGLTGAGVLLAHRPSGVISQQVAFDGLSPVVHLPCDVDGLALLTQDGASVPDPSCPLGAPFTCIIPGTHAATLRAGPLITLDVQVVDAHDERVPGAFAHDGIRRVEVAASGKLAWRGWPDLPLIIQAPGYLPTAQPAHRSSLWRATLERGREVVLRHTPATAVGIPVTCQAPGAAPSLTTCRDELTGWVCTCPEGPADILARSLRTPVPAEAINVTLDLSSIKGSLVGHAPVQGPCTIRLTEQISTFAALRGVVPRQLRRACDAGATFEVPHLPQGRYTTQLHTLAETVVREVEIRDSQLDIGERPLSR